jgi:CRP-like cAMP-binding protein
MPLSAEPGLPVKNRLLAALTKKEQQRLLPELEPIALTFAEVLYEPGDTIRHVYFPNNSTVSLLSALAGRSTIEVGNIGSDGMAGIAIFMGVDKSSDLAVVQAAGTAMRLKSETLCKEVNHVGSLHRLLRRYTHSLLIQASQSAVCNRFHTVDVRLARWLLMTSDRVGRDEYQVTQEFMSRMLGVRREGVNKAAGVLQKQEFISYRRGQIRINDRAGLEGVCCECYRIIKDESDSYLVNS